MDILLLGSYTRYSCFLMKLNLQRSKLSILLLPSTFPDPIPSYWVRELTFNEIHDSKLNWRHFFYNIHVYSTSIYLSPQPCPGLVMCASNFSYPDVMRKISKKHVSNFCQSLNAFGLEWFQIIENDFQYRFETD